MISSTRALSKLAAQYFAIGLFSRVIIITVPIVITPLLLTVFGVEKFSYWSIVLQISIALNFIDFGTSSRMVNLISIKGSTSDREEVEKVFSVVLFSSIVFLFLGIVFLLFWEKLYYISIAVIIAAFLNILTPISKIRLAFNQSHIQYIFDAISKFVSSIVACLVAISTKSLEYSIISFYLTQLCVGLLNGLFIKNTLRFIFSRYIFSLKVIWDTIKKSVAIFGSQLLYFFVYGLDAIFIERSLGPIFLTTYFIHKIPFDLVVSLFSLVVPLLWPLVNQSKNDDNFGKNLTKILKVVFSVLMIIFTIFSIAIYIFQHDIISTISSAKVESSEVVVLSMIFSCFISIYTVIQTNIAMGLSMYDEYFNRMAVTAIVGLFLKWFAFQHFGLHGGILISALIIVCFLIIPMHYDLKRAIGVVLK